MRQPKKYTPGKVRAICDRCGFEYPLAELRKEWTGLMVCKSDWDYREPQLEPPKVAPEGVAVPNNRPDNQIFTVPNTTTRDDL